MDSVINVIDMMPNSGKGDYMIDRINSGDIDKFIYVVQHLAEINLILDKINNNIDINKVSKVGDNTKKDEFVELLRYGNNICITHKLLQGVGHDTRELLADNGYTLILDEVMNVVKEVPNFTEDDFTMLTNRDEVAYVKDDYLLWNHETPCYDGRFNDIRSMSLNQNLLLINNRLLFWNFPVDIFELFEEVYILTHRFESSMQKYYFDFHGINYSIYQVVNNNMVDYREDIEVDMVNSIAHKITIYEGKMNNVGDAHYSLSLNWFKENTQQDIVNSVLKNNVYNWFNNINNNVGSQGRMWTTFKDYKDEVKGKGYTRAFAPMNYRFENKHSNATILSYCANRFVRPSTIQFFDKRDIKVDQDEYALSEMLRWIWKSGLDKGEDISIYIPSKRMRGLLFNWLDV